MARLHFMRWSLILGLLWLSGCQKPAPELPQTSAENREAETFPPGELIAANIRETEVSLSLIFNDVTTVREPKDNDIYGEWRIRATVKRPFQGDFKPGDPFVFFWRFEKGIAEPRAQGASWIGSFKRDEKGDYHVPDNGYVFEYSKELEGLFEKAVAEKGK